MSLLEDSKDIIAVNHAVIAQADAWLKDFKASNNRATDSTKSVDNRTADPHNRKVIA